MVIKVLEHVPNCFSWEAGQIIGHLIRDQLASGQRVTVSFSGVRDVPSSFVNAAFVNLLDVFSLDRLKQSLDVVDSTRQINDMIRRRLAAGTSDPSTAAPPRH